MVNIINEITYFLFIYVLVALSYPTLCDSMDCSCPGSSVHGILQAEVLEWVAIPFSRGSSHPRAQTQVSCIVGRFFTFWITKEALFVIYRALLKFFQYYKFYGLLFSNLSCIKYYGKIWNKWKGWPRVVKKYNWSIMYCFALEEFTIILVSENMKE